MIPDYSIMLIVDSNTFTFSIPAACPSQLARSYTIIMPKTPTTSAATSKKFNYTVHKRPSAPFYRKVLGGIFATCFALTYLVTLPYILLSIYVLWDYFVRSALPGWMIWTTVPFVIR